jgi:hypothetical protein
VAISKLRENAINMGKAQDAIIKRLGLTDGEYKILPSGMRSYILGAAIREATRD